MNVRSGTHADFDAALAARIDGKTKPPGALGRIETLAAQIARVQRSLTPRMETCHLTIFAADHGMARAGVSAYPQAVTRQMVLNFLAGGAAANVFAASVGAGLSVVDAGIAGAPLHHPDLRRAAIAPGTADAIATAAMTAAQRDRALAAGHAIGAGIEADAVCFGEMGIGNTSAAALLAHKILGLPLADVTGPGTGLNAEGLARKQALLRQAAARTAARLPAEAALAEYGGFEIAMMAGAIEGAAAQSRVVIIDGFIATAAALIAVHRTAAIADFLVYSHISAERGHGAMLHALGATPLLDLRLRLGEGTGALLAWPLVKAAAAMLTRMASFEDAGVTGPI